MYNFKLFNLLIVITFISSSQDDHFVFADDGGDNDNVCENMKQPGNNSLSKGILCIGQLTNNRLVVITRDWYVFILPLRSLSDAIDKLYVNDTKPELLNQKWEKLGNDKQFEYAKNHIYNSFVWVTPNDDDLIFFTMRNTEFPFWNENPGIAYNVDDDKVYEAINYFGSDDQVLIGTYKSYEFYAISKKKGSSQTTMAYYHKHSSHPNSGITPTSKFFPICKNGSSKIFLSHNSDISCESPNWPVMNGLIFNQRFYLYGPTFVITFSEKIWSNNEQPVELMKISYDNFVQCGGTINVPDFDPGNPTKKSPTKWALIAAIILIILLLLLCCLLCLLRQGSTTRNKNKKKITKSSKIKDKKMSLKDHQSTRSKALISGGRLSQRSIAKGGSIMNKMSRASSMKQNLTSFNNNNLITERSKLASSQRVVESRKFSMGRKSLTFAPATQRSCLKK